MTTNRSITDPVVAKLLRQMDMSLERRADHANARLMDISTLREAASIDFVRRCMYPVDSALHDAFCRSTQAT